MLHPDRYGIKRLFIWSSALVFIVLVTACASAAAPTTAPATSAPTSAPQPTAVPATSAPTSAPKPTAAPPTAAAPLSLLEAAKKEGKAMVYTSLNADEFEVVLKEFSTKYPDIKIEFYRGDSESVTQKALTEFRAKTYVADVLETNDVNITQLMSEGVVGTYVSPEAASFPAGAKDPEGGYVAARLNLLVIAYNTQLVKKDDAPKKLEDLLDAKWSGKIAIEADDWPMLAYTSKVMGDAAANDFWTKLAKQKVRVVKGHTELANFLVAGEFAVSPTVYAHRVLSLQDKKAPIEMVKTGTAYAFPHVVAIAKNVAHPNAAKLFIDWYLSEDGQNALVKAGRIPVRPGIKTKPAGVLDGFANIFYGDPKTLLKAADAQKQYYTLFGIK